MWVLAWSPQALAAHSLQDMRTPARSGDGSAAINGPRKRSQCVPSSRRSISARVCPPARRRLLRATRPSAGPPSLPCGPKPTVGLTRTLRICSIRSARCNLRCALPLCAGGTAKRCSQKGQKVTSRRQLACSRVRIFDRRISFASRSCSVPNSRSMRPLAGGLCDRDPLDVQFRQSPPELRARRSVVQLLLPLRGPGGHDWAVLAAYSASGRP